MALDTLESMRAFARVVELGGFAAAARRLAISPAMVTRHVVSLEERLGARLLQRTTRVVRPTEAGQLYYERCIELLQGLEEADAAVSAVTVRPRGTLRVTAPVEFGNRHLVGPVVGFMQQHPELAVMLDLSNRLVDVVDEGYDLAIRVTNAPDPALVARRLAVSRMHVVASPGYLAGQGHPAEPAALAERDCLCFAVPAARDDWCFRRDGSMTTVKVKSRLLSTSSEALLGGARAGAGISWLPTFVCGDDLRSGALVSLFPDHDVGGLGVHVVYPHRRFLPVKLRLFIDHLVAHFGGDSAADPWA